MTLALHLTGLPFVGLIILSLAVAVGLIHLLSDNDDEEDRWR